MGIFSNLFSKPEVESSNSEDHLLMIVIPLSGGEYGDEEERKKIRVLEHDIEKGLKDKQVGEYDGDEFGDRECSIYLYGPNADDLLKVARPYLEKFSIKPIIVHLQYGAASDVNAKEKRLAIN